MKIPIIAPMGTIMTITVIPTETAILPAGMAGGTTTIAYLGIPKSPHDTLYLLRRFAPCTSCYGPLEGTVTSVYRLRGL